MKNSPNRIIHYKIAQNQANQVNLTSYFQIVLRYRYYSGIFIICWHGKNGKINLPEILVDRDPCCCTVHFMIVSNTDAYLRVKSRMKTYACWLACNACNIKSVVTKAALLLPLPIISPPLLNSGLKLDFRRVIWQMSSTLDEASVLIQGCLYNSF